MVLEWCGVLRGLLSQDIGQVMGVVEALVWELHQDKEGLIESMLRDPSSQDNMRALCRLLTSTETRLCSNAAYILGSIAESETGTQQLVSLGGAGDLLGTLTALLSWDDAEAVMNAAGTIGTLMALDGLEQDYTEERKARDISLGVKKKMGAAEKLCYKDIAEKSVPRRVSEGRRRGHNTRGWAGYYTEERKARDISLGVKKKMGAAEKLCYKDIAEKSVPRRAIEGRLVNQRAKQTHLLGRIAECEAREAELRSRLKELQLEHTQHKFHLGAETERYGAVREERRGHQLTEELEREERRRNLWSSRLRVTEDVLHTSQDGLDDLFLKLYSFTLDSKKPVERAPLDSYDKLISCELKMLKLLDYFFSLSPPLQASIEEHDKCAMLFITGLKTGAMSYSEIQAKLCQNLEKLKVAVGCSDIKGLEMVEHAREWYHQQVQAVQERQKHMGKHSSSNDFFSEASQSRLTHLLPKLQDVNRCLGDLMSSSGQPCTSSPSAPDGLAPPAASNPQHATSSLANPHQAINMLKDQNRLLTKEVTDKSERITQLEQEKSALIKQLFEARAQSNHETSALDSTFI
ncbi:UNVERIFIED_CONTAM: hypothetical protein FKN15_045993 [Acipenser sinensis]